MRKLEHEEIPRISPADLESAERYPISILLEDIRSAHNVGSIIRTADAIRAAHIFLAGVTASGDHKGVHKSALGAQDAVPWEYVNSALACVKKARASGITVVGLEITDSPTDLKEFSKEKFPIMLVVGNEVEGISAEVLEACDHAIELPQYGMKQSLNVSVAAGVALYDMLRIYLGSHKFV